MPICSRALALKGIILLFSLSLFAEDKTAAPQWNPEQALKDFKTAMELYRNPDSKEVSKSVEIFEGLKNPKFSLIEYVYFYQGMAYRSLKNDDMAEKNLRAVANMNPNLKLLTDSMLERSIMALEKGHYKEAKSLLAPIEKRNRGAEAYPEILFDLAKAEKGLHSQAMMCKHLIRLYEKHPAFEKIGNWSSVLAENIFDGAPSRCPNNLEQFRTRVKNLLWNGQDKRALDEISLLRQRNPDEDQKYRLDSIEAALHFQEGNIELALSLLKPHFEKNKYNFGFLMQFGHASARAGDLASAVSAYDAAYRLSPKSTKGKSALFQSAFMSYQFKDYETALKKFKDFKKVGGGAKEVREASWYLAWISYLKGDYQNALKSFQELRKESRRNSKLRKVVSPERLNYWTGMAYLRLGKKESAKEIFKQIGKDKLYGYYSLAAQARLRNFPNEEIKIPVLNSEIELPLRRFSRAELLVPSLDPDLLYTTNSMDYEEDIQIAAESEEESSDVAGDETPGDSKQVEVSEVPASEEATVFHDPRHIRRFEKARDLMIVGLSDLAKWDLWEIERTTRNRDYLRTLMAEYLRVGNYNRTSTIAQLNFSQARAAYGMNGIRFMWEYAYPQAFDKQVKVSSERFGVPTELIWSIMRTESVYRKDAISPVGALGLMQVMPYTAQRVAKLIGEKDFQVKSLLEPEPAIKIGTRYLRRLMDRFSSSIPLVSAGYNAGPHRVESWIKNFGDLETDEFVEHIPFSETRNYVKKVISNAQVYSDLYGDKRIMVPHLANKLPAIVIEARMPAAKENWDDL